MLTDDTQSIAISSLGWVDRGSLWILRVGDAQPTSVALSEANYLSLHRGRHDMFAVAHSFGGARLEITVHAFHDPGIVIAGLSVAGDGRRVWGDMGAWANVPTNYVAYYAGPHWSDYCLVRLRRSDAEVELQQFTWYDRKYDQDYQAVIGVTEIPGEDVLMVSVQRSSTLVLHDPGTQRQVGEVRLSGRGGNPSLYFCRSATELWAADYDTILKVKPGSWKRLRSRRVQGSAWGTQQFIGSFWLDPQESTCIVARPFSGDVIAIEPDRLKTRATWRTNGQPIEAVLLRDETVVTRDWKTGALLQVDS